MFDNRIPSDHPDAPVEAPPVRPLTAREKARLEAQHWSWIRMIAGQSLAGMAIGALAALAVIYLDINQIGSMIAASPNRGVATALLLWGFASIFGMATAGTAIWMRAVYGDE